MKPQIPDGLDFVKASYHSVYGKIVREWEKRDGMLIWNIIIPANTSAQVYLPGVSANAEVIEKALKESPEYTVLGKEGEYLVLSVPSGTHKFVVK